MPVKSIFVFVVASASKLAAALGGSLGSVTVVVGVGVLVFFLLKRRSVFVHNPYFSGDTFINPLRCSDQEDKVDKRYGTDILMLACVKSRTLLPNISTSSYFGANVLECRASLMFWILL